MHKTLSLVLLRRSLTLALLATMVALALVATTSIHPTQAHAQTVCKWEYQNSNSKVYLDFTVTSYLYEYVETADNSTYCGHWYAKAIVTHPGGEEHLSGTVTARVAPSTVSGKASWSQGIDALSVSASSPSVNLTPPPTGCPLSAVATATFGNGHVLPVTALARGC